MQNSKNENLFFDLLFNWRKIPSRGRGLTFDDVLLAPRKSEVRSRRDPSLRHQTIKGLELEIPIISANMDTVTEAEMAIAMAEYGGLGLIHRFMSTEDQVSQVRKVAEAGALPFGASIGVGEDADARAGKLIAAGCKIIVIDIAHGHSAAMLETLKNLKQKFPNISFIAGNVAMPEAVTDLIEAGADAIKVGIGPGSMCTTRIITGCGVPQLTAIAMCALAAEGSGVPIIADGGFRSSGDLVKAFAAGADAIMLGSMLAGAIETPGEIQSGRKIYRGMASKSAQVSWRGGVPEGMAAEGESTYVTVKGPVRNVLQEITGGIRSGMSYLNAVQISEIKSNAQFMEMSASGIAESSAHGMRF